MKWGCCLRSRAGLSANGDFASSGSFGRERGRTAVFAALTRERIDAEKLVAAAKRGEDGAVVVFDGIVRNHSRGRRTLHLDYEAYEEMAVRQMRELANQARGRFGVRQVTIVHRLGRLEIGETSILIVVASAHRSAAFEACRWLIDTLKKTVPIWKKETFVDGAVWAPGEPFPEGLAVEISARGLRMKPGSHGFFGICGRAGLGALLALAPLTLAAQETTTFHVDVKLVNIFVNVTDQNGSIVGGLTRDDFAVFEDGRPQQIAIFERQSELPLNLTLAIDTSAACTRI